ncbi:copper chaperone PCu(A)C [Avibacterium gallinarum]|uniref:copper chaperone PCu(A)C n=1 Tax=Avibacterium gallinarum TaxID=755 RepID=UPI003BF81CBD
MNAMKKIGLICTALFPLATQAEIVASQATIFPTEKAGQPSAIFMLLQNTGNEAVNLLFAESQQPARLELHGMHNGKMHALNGIEIPAKQSVSLKRGGLHIMVFDLTQPIQRGETFPIKLFFDDGEVVEINAEAATK